MLILDSNKVSCGILTIELEPSCRNEKGEVIFNNLSFKVKIHNLEEIRVSVSNYLMKIKYPYIRAYLSGCILENEKSTVDAERIIELLKYDSHIKPYADAFKEEDTSLENKKHSK